MVHAALAALLAAPLLAAGNRGVNVPGAPKGVNVPGAAASVPALPASAAARGTALSGALPAAAQSVPRITAADAASAVPAGAKALTASERAGDTARAADGAQTAGEVLRGLLREPEQVSPKALRAAFDGQVEKGSLEEELLAVPDARGRLSLSQRDASSTGDMTEKKALKKLRKDQEKLDELQQVLYADHSRRVLVVLQAMDTGGKDGTIRHVMRSLNPQGVQVASFKKPTKEEARHHYLWRIKKALPGPGMIGIFNRSHYEDILVPTVYGTVPAKDVEKRYAEINAFEKKLADEGWTILKFFLHISKDEQKARLQARLDEPDKNWKFSKEDLKTRALWPSFMAAYEKILARTSTPWAPWYIVPANNKWYRDYVVGRILKHALKALDLKYPDPPADLPRTIPD